jgi:hypothetical protein
MSDSDKRKRDSLFRLTLVYFQLQGTGMAIHAYRSLPALTKWLLGGSLALLYAILSDPQRAVAGYGFWQTSLALGALCVSFVVGGFNLLVRKVADGTDPELAKTQYELQKQLASEAPAPTAAPLTEKEAVEHSVRNVVNVWIPVFKAAVSPALQALSLALALLILVGSFAYRGYHHQLDKQVCAPTWPEFKAPSP